MIELLKKLISIESLSKQEHEIVAFVAQLLEENNVKGWKRLNNSIIWQSEYRPERKTIAFCGHLDTVGFDESKWSKGKPLEPMEKDGKIYGRGSCDMKGGVSVLLDILLNEDYGDKYNTVFIFYDKEELGMPNGITDIFDAELLPPIDFVMIPEPTELKVNYGVFGSLDASILAHGKAAHTSRSELGENAIYNLCKGIEKVRNFELRNVGDNREKISVNTISGGKNTNMIPHEASATIDFRYDPNISESEAKERLTSLNKNKFEVHVNSVSTGVIHDPTDKYIKKLIPLCDGSYVDVYWSDIAQFARHDIVAVNIGPGSIKRAHIADEYVEIEDLHRLRKIFVEFLRE